VKKSKQQALHPPAAPLRGARAGDSNPGSDRPASAEDDVIQPTSLDRLRQILGGATLAVVSPAVLPPARLDGEFGVLYLALSLALLILSLGIHEAAHAWAALKCGDPTARDLGRLTLNPIPHIDLWWTILIPGMFLYVSGGRFLFGGAKPVPVDFHRLKNPWRDMSIVAFAGPLSNLILVGVFVALWKFFVTTGYYNGAAEGAYQRQNDLLPAVLMSAVGANAILFVFNLIPLPPLDGSRIMTWLLPSSLRESYNAIGVFGLIGVFLLMRWEPFGDQIRRLTNLVIEWAEKVVSLGGVW
jgi:Zn-dependent protease